MVSVGTESIPNGLDLAELWREGGFKVNSRFKNLLVLPKIKEIQEEKGVWAGETRK